MTTWQYARMVFEAREFGAQRPSGGNIEFSTGEPLRTFPGGDFWTQLDRLGRDGWELVAQHQRSFADGEIHSYFWFKRPVEA